MSPQWSVFKGLTQDELVEKLEEQCKNVHTDVKHSTLANLAKAIQSILKDWNADSIIYANDDRFDKSGLIPFFKEKTFECNRWDPNLREEYIKFAKNADVGNTFSDVTLAESGTVVLYNEGKKRRPVSHLPESYIAIV